MIIMHALQHSFISHLLVPHLVSIVLKSKVKMCPQVGLVVVREEGAFFKVSYEPSNRKVIWVCVGVGCVWMWGVGCVCERDILCIMIHTV